MKRDRPTPPLRGDAFEVHRADVGDEIEIAYVREGRGGCRSSSSAIGRAPSGSGGATSNPLVKAGFEVIVPDLRGFGDSTVPAGPTITGWCR